MKIITFEIELNPLSANPTKWSNTLKQFVGKLLRHCLSVFDYFVGLALKGLSDYLRLTDSCHDRIVHPYHVSDWFLFYRDLRHERVN